MAPLETLLDASYGFYSSQSITDITFNIQITRHAKQQRFNTKHACGLSLHACGLSLHAWGLVHAFN